MIGRADEGAGLYEVETDAVPKLLPILKLFWSNPSVYWQVSA
jgi:hypothetical protein